MSDAPGEGLALLPEVDARRLLRGAVSHLHVLRPPFAAIGVGTLRVLRVRERGDGMEIVAGYDGYERAGGERR